jgi:hypothetical protein
MHEVDQAAGYPHKLLMPSGNLIEIEEGENQKFPRYKLYLYPLLFGHDIEVLKT